MEQPIDLTEQAELINFVKQMKLEVDSLKNEDLVNKDKINMLTAEIIQLRATVRACLPASNMPNPNEFIHGPLHEINNSEVSDNDLIESEAQNGSVSDQESVISVPISRKKGNPKNKT